MMSSDHRDKFEYDQQSSALELSANYASTATDPVNLESGFPVAAGFASHPWDHFMTKRHLLSSLRTVIKLQMNTAQST